MQERDLVFIGGGHCHALVLRMMAMKPLPNVRVTLVTDTLLTPYSGMLPGYIAGHYSLEETHLDLNALCHAAGVRLIHARAAGLKLDAQQVLLENGSHLHYDKLSINTGSTPNLTVPGAEQFALGVKPVSQLTEQWHQLLVETKQDIKPHWAIVGAGAAGVEMALAITHRFAREHRSIKLSLVQAGSELLPGYHPKLQQRVQQALKQAGIEWVTQFRVAQVTENELISDNQQRLTMQQSIWCTPATAPIWPKQAGLAVNERGFIEVNTALQSTSHVNVFACGDMAHMAASPRAKAGVFAVRSAPFLYRNLAAAFAGNPLEAVKLQKEFLSLISLGGAVAVGQRNGLSFSGGWVWRWKDRIDRKFMDLFGSKLPRMSNNMAKETMHCAGCGSKLGPDLLSDILPTLTTFQPQKLGTQAEDAALAIDQPPLQVWQSIDGFRAFTRDDYRLGTVATLHALNDIYAMGLTPTSAQVWVNLEFNHPRLLQRDFQRLMQGVADTLVAHETQLIGGHSTEGAETHLALVVNATGQAKWLKTGAQAGDWLLLNKPLGSGVILAADAQQRASTHAVEACWNVLMQSNLGFFNALQQSNVHAATDVTGFGLVGHLLEMLGEGELTATLHTQHIPIIDGALTLSELGIQSSLLPQLLPKLTQCKSADIHNPLHKLLIDPQTNGGLLVALPAQQAQAIVKQGLAWHVGTIGARVKGQEAIVIE